jgi:primosomal protein N'
MMDNHFADIILPLAVKGTFTYAIPEPATGIVLEGSRVLVQFGNKSCIPEL